MLLIRQWMTYALYKKLLYQHNGTKVKSFEFSSLYIVNEIENIIRGIKKK